MLAAASAASQGLGSAILMQKNGRQETKLPPRRDIEERQKKKSRARGITPRRVAAPPKRTGARDGRARDAAQTNNSETHTAHRRATAHPLHTHTGIATVGNTQKITEAMRLVAAAKVRRAQEAVLQTRPFGKERSSPSSSA